MCWLKVPYYAHRKRQYCVGIQERAAWTSMGPIRVCPFPPDELALVLHDFADVEPLYVQAKPVLGCLDRPKAIIGKVGDAWAAGVGKGESYVTQLSYHLSDLLREPVAFGDQGRQCT